MTTAYDLLVILDQQLGAARSTVRALLDSQRPPDPDPKPDPGQPLTMGQPDPDG